jgi:hypothetical protein
MTLAGQHKMRHRLGNCGSVTPQIAGLSALIFIIALGAASLVEAQTSVRSPEDGKPGNYVLWASKQDAVCERIKTTINALPNKDLVKASLQGRAGFLKWKPENWLESERFGAKSSYLQVTSLTSHLDGSSKPMLILRWSASTSGIESDYIWVIRENKKVPTNGDEFAELRRSREADFRGAIDWPSMQKVRKMHGDAWPRWQPESHVSVWAMSLEGRVYFLAQSTPPPPRWRNALSRILVFTLDANGVERDVCMLRRVCGCKETNCIKELAFELELSPADRERITPAKQFCVS